MSFLLVSIARIYRGLRRFKRMKFNMEIVPESKMPDELKTHRAFCSGDVLLSHDLSPYYHRGCSVSLPCSEWERVVPLRRGHQNARRNFQAALVIHDDKALLGAVPPRFCYVAAPGRSVLWQV